MVISKQRNKNQEKKCIFAIKMWKNGKFIIRKRNRITL